MPGTEEITVAIEKPTISSAFTRRDLVPVLSLIVLVLFLYYPLLLGRPVMPDTWERFEPWNTELGLSGPTDPEITHSNN
ncbi:MAG: hypothetical protein NTY09_12180, partial [bacterium]|nr:hypothetical protein [bacterium]